jgi:RimJ/RimL family protein N-acetyltransferase
LKHLPEALSTANTELRLVQPTDVPALGALLHENAARFRHWIGVHAASLNDGKRIAREIVRASNMAREPGAVGSYVAHGIWTRDSRTLIGWSTIADFGSDAMEVGIALSRRGEGKGHASEALGALTYVASGEPEIVAIYARVDTSNQRSLDLFGRFPFRTQQRLVTGDRFFGSEGHFPSGQGVLARMPATERETIPARYRPLAIGADAHESRLGPGLA